MLSNNKGAIILLRMVCWNFSRVLIWKSNKPSLNNCCYIVLPFEHSIEVSTNHLWTLSVILNKCRLFKENHSNLSFLFFLYQYSHVQVVYCSYFLNHRSSISISISLYLSISLFLSLYLSIHLSINLSIHPSIHPSI